MAIALRSGSATDIGHARSTNEDAILMGEEILAVADGMGGHVSGEVASSVAIEALKASAEPSAEGLASAMELANRAVWLRAAEDPQLQGMGTTMTALTLVPKGSTLGGSRIAIANVGDSRAYRFAHGELTQTTHDHSLVEELVRAGRLTSEATQVHPKRSVLTRALGHAPEVDVDILQITAAVGDRYLLCSDGLSDVLHDADIVAVLSRLQEPQAAATELVRAAKEAGGRDNITAIVVDLVDKPTPESEVAHRSPE